MVQIQTRESSRAAESQRQVQVISADEGEGEGVGWQREVGRGRTPLLSISVDADRLLTKKQNVAESTLTGCTEGKSCEGSVPHVVLSPVSA